VRTVRQVAICPSFKNTGGASGSIKPAPFKHSRFFAENLRTMVNLQNHFLAHPREFALRKFADCRPMTYHIILLVVVSKARIFPIHEKQHTDLLDKWKRPGQHNTWSMHNGPWKSGAKKSQVKPTARDLKDEEVEQWATLNSEDNNFTENQQLSLSSLCHSFRPTSSSATLTQGPLAATKMTRCSQLLKQSLLLPSKKKLSRCRFLLLCLANSEVKNKAAKEMQMDRVPTCPT
jgi:hypothetical protein